MDTNLRNAGEKTISTRAAIAVTGVALALLVFAHLSYHYFGARAAADSRGALVYKPEILAAEYIYVSAAREAWEGKIPPKDAYLFERKGAPMVIDPIPPILTAALGWLSGSFSNGILLVYAVFPVISFFMALAFARRLSGSLWAAPVIAFVAITFPWLFVNYTRWFHLWREIASSDPNFARFFNPVLTRPFLLFFLIAHHRFFFARGGGPGAALVLAVAAALNFYVYTNYSTYVLIAVFFLLLFRVVDPQSRTRSDRINIAVFVIAFSILAAPYLIHRYQTLFITEEIKFRMGFCYGKFFLLNPFAKTMIAAAVCAVALAVKLVDFRKFLYFITLLVPSLLLQNIQLFTGFNMTPWHSEKYVQGPVQTFILLSIAALALKRPPLSRLFASTFAKAAAAMLILGFFTLGATVETKRYVEFLKPMMASAKKYQPLERFLNERAAPDAVLIASAAANPAYDVATAMTGANVFLPSSVSTEISEGFIERYLITLKLYGIERVTDPMFDSNAWNHFFAYTYHCSRECTTEPRENYPEWARKRMNDYSIAAQEFIVSVPEHFRGEVRRRFDRLNLAAGLTRYRIDYALCDGEQELRAVRAALDGAGVKYRETRLDGELVVIELSEAGLRSKSR